MKRFFTFLTTFSLAGTFGRHPVIAGVLSLLGIGGGAGIAMLTPPTLLPQVSAYLNQNQSFGFVNNPFQPNRGTAGATELPTTPTNSFTVYADVMVDSNQSWGTGAVETLFNGLTLTSNVSPGAPTFQFLKVNSGSGTQPGVEWWEAISGVNNPNSASAAVGTGYTNALNVVTPSGTGCVRPPTVVWLGQSGNVQSIDPGFECNTSLASIPAVTIPGSGAQQATGAGSIATTCAVANGVPTVSATMAVAHGVVAGQQYTLSGFGAGFTGYNQTNYVATPSTTSTKLVGTSPSMGSCPTSPVTAGNEGRALNGTGGQINFPTLSATNPWTVGGTGVTAKSGQHICVAVGELGDDSAAPGFQYFDAMDADGSLLPGSPALSTWPNQGAANETGYALTGTQTVATPTVTSIASGAMTVTSGTGLANGQTIWAPGWPTGMVITAGSGTSWTISNTSFAFTGSQSAMASVPALTITAPLTYSISSGTPPTYDGATGYIHFTMGAGTGLIPGSEFKVSGLSSANSVNLNLTYIAVAGTTQSGTTLVGNPLAGGPGTAPFAVAPPGAITASSALLTPQITPGQLVLGGAFNTAILPYGAAGSTGLGDVGTYMLTYAPTAAINAPGSPGNIFTYASFYHTATAGGAGGIATIVARTQAAQGDFFSVVGGSSATSIVGLATGWGGSIGNLAMLWNTTSTANAAPDLTTVCKKTVDIPAFATSIGASVHSLYRMNDPGIWGDSTRGDFTGSTNGSTLTITSPAGGLALATGTVISGAGLPCPATCPTISTGSGSPATTYTLSASVGTIAAESMKAGAWSPMLTVPPTNLTGWIDGSPATTLHVSSLQVSGNTGFATFSGQLGNKITASPGGTTIAVTAPTTGNAVLGIGSVLNCPACTPTSTTVTGLGTALGLNGTYTVSPSMTGSAASVIFVNGPLPGPPTSLQVTAGGTGTVVQQMVVKDATPGTFLTGDPLVVTGASVAFGSNTLFAVSGNYYPASTSATRMNASLSTLVPGEYIRNASITQPTKIVGYGTGVGGLGTYTLSADNGLIGTSGSQLPFTGTTITDGGAIAPGPALTIKDLGPGTIYPVLNYTSGTGSLWLNGSYDAATLGGTPSAIQAQISLSANGPPISGCSACAWTNLSSGVVSGGKWSGQAVNIPAGGPLYVSVRAANGTAYATLPNGVRLGLAFDAYGQGQTAGIMGTIGGGANLGYYSGLWGVTSTHSAFSGFYYLTSGPPIAPTIGNLPPAATTAIAGDRYGILGSGTPLSEAVGGFEQNLSAAFGDAWPASMSNITRDGVGNFYMATGNVLQTQTVGVGDGSSTVWCSQPEFCADPANGYQQPLIFNQASLTGASFSGTIASDVLTVGASTNWVLGALEPGMVLSGNGGIVGSPALIACLTNCPVVGDTLPATSTWSLTHSASAVSNGVMRADPTSALIPFGLSSTPWPNYNFQESGASPVTSAGGAFMVKYGTFQLSVNGTVVCTDSNTFAYGQNQGNCTGANIYSSLVNYTTGDYQVTFITPPASGAVITAQWTNITPGIGLFDQTYRLQAVDYMGDGSAQSGYLSSIFAQTPGGVSGHINSGCSTDEGFILQSSAPNAARQGYQWGAPGYSQEVSWLYGTKFPHTFPGMSANAPMISSLQYRDEGPIYFNSGVTPAKLNYCDQWGQDLVTNSTWSGSISGGALTLGSSPAVGPMWEGEVLGGASVPSGMYITGLTGGAWGAASSTYSLAGASGVTLSNVAMQNAVYYSGGPTIYTGPVYDIVVGPASLSTTTINEPHPYPGMAGGPRVGRRWAAEIWGGFTDPGVNFPPHASAPTVDRVKADATGCDAAALAAPCFDIGTTYQASHSATMVSSSATITVTGGISANARPFVVGQVLACSGCTAGRVITALDVPPTQSTVSGAGEVGQTFHITASGTMGVSATETLTAGCAGTSGTGSNCIDVAIQINTTTGTYGTAAALATCGANNLSGNAPNYALPSGLCQDNGIGEITRGFRIGTTQLMLGTVSTGTLSPGSVFDDGVDYDGGTFNQSAAFTCNIVAAKVVQCVLGPKYTSGLFVSVGEWLTGSTYLYYGDMSVVSGRYGSLLGYPGGQSFPITSGGTGYSNQTALAAVCTTLASGGFAPRFDIWTSGGVIVDIQPSAIQTSGKQPTGLGIGSACTLTPAGGSGTVSVTIPLAPTEGSEGIGTYNTDSNTMGMFLYDNSGFPGNPLNKFFTNGQGGYFEPGLPVRPFGEFQGAAVSG